MMKWLACLIALALAISSVSAGIEPRKSLQEYPSHIESPAADVGVEYQVHSYSAEGQMYFTKDYLVCEVGIYPKTPLELHSDSFELRVNRAKTAIPEAGPEFVAASLKYPDWTQHPQLEVGAGVGDSGVVLGRPDPVGRFPGDPSIGRPQAKAPRAPDDPNKVEHATADPAKLVLDTALPTGKIGKPVAGNIYFPYSGNVKKIRSLSLILHTAMGDVEIPLR
jgi:hypothetical protein